VTDGTATRILLVEDEPRNIALMRAILVPRGYDLVVAETFSAARSWLADERPDLLLLDRHLPDGDGLDIAREMRANPERQTVPIVLVSASVLPADQQAASDAGCDVFLPKPIRIDALLEEVARLSGAG
jgi:CheY-like chemotaxis protein